MDERVIQIAAETMKTDIETATTNCKKISEIDAWYFWNPIRGGISVIVASNYEKLGATSAVSYDKHLRAFLDGKRN